GVRRRVRARAGAGGPDVSGLALFHCCRLVCLTFLRYARGPGLGFGHVVRSAAEEYGSGGLSAFSGASARRSSGGRRLRS
ncbi:unnamed protein product, partial [Brassica rapa]